MTPESFILITIALGAGAVVKGATGMGLPMIAVPVLAASFGVPHALAIMALPLLLTNVWQVWRYRAYARSMAFLPGLLVTGGIGIGIGTWLLTAVSEKGLSLALGAMLLAYLGLRLGKPDLRIGERAGRGLAPAVGLAAGALQGATGMSTPVGVTFIHAMRLDRETHVFAVSAMFLLFSVTQLPALAVAGIMTWSRLFEGVFALVPVLVLMPFGAWLSGRLSREAFDRLILVLLCIVAVKLLADALMG